MPHTPIEYPLPWPQLGQGTDVEGEPIEVDIPTVKLQHPLPNTLEVLDEQQRNQNPLDSETFIWPFGGPLAILVINGYGVAVDVEIHGSFDPSTQRDLSNPFASFTVGMDERDIQTLLPMAGDPWAPVVWAKVTPQNDPSDGSVTVRMARLGGL